MVYKQRKQIKNVKIRLDLTKVRRFSLLKKAREKIENNDKVKFVYADINCRLRLHPTTGKDCFFDTLEDIEKYREIPIISPGLILFQRPFLPENNRQNNRIT